MTQRKCDRWWPNNKVLLSASNRNRKNFNKIVNNRTLSGVDKSGGGGGGGGGVGNNGVNRNGVHQHRSAKAYARNPNFETKETRTLLLLWGDPIVQRTLVTTHKKFPVIAELAEKMRQHGYHRSPIEINTRIKNLKCFYNKIKKDLDAGVISQSTWTHFDTMDEILNRPIFGNTVQQPHLEKQHLQYWKTNKLKNRNDDDDKDDNDEDVDEDADDDDDYDYDDIDDADYVVDDDDVDDDDDDDDSNDNVTSNKNKKRRKRKRPSSIPNPFDDSSNDEFRPEDLLSIEDGVQVDENNIDSAIEQQAEQQPKDKNNEHHTEEELLVPKSEPINVDDDDTDDDDNDSCGLINMSNIRNIMHDDVPENTNDLIPKVSAYLGLTYTKNQNNSMPPPLTQLTTSVDTTTVTTVPMTSIITKKNKSKGSNIEQQPSVLSKPLIPNNTNSISIIPRNILMQNNQQQKQRPQQQSQQPIRPKPQSFLYAKNLVGDTSGVSDSSGGGGTSGNRIIDYTQQTIYTTSTSGLPMKVLFLNKLPNTSSSTTLASFSTPLLNSINTNTFPPLSRLSTQQSQQQQQQQQEPIRLSTIPTIQNQNTSTGSDRRQITNHQSWKQETNSTDYKGLLNRLVQLQNEALNLAEQRLEIEKSRLNFEMSVGDTFLKYFTDEIIL